MRYPLYTWSGLKMGLAHCQPRTRWRQVSVSQLTRRCHHHQSSPFRSLLIAGCSRLQLGVDFGTRPISYEACLIFGRPFPTSARLVLYFTTHASYIYPYLGNKSSEQWEGEAARLPNPPSPPQGLSSASTRTDWDKPLAETHKHAPTTDPTQPHAAVAHAAWRRGLDDGEQAYQARPAVVFNARPTRSSPTSCEVDPHPDPGFFGELHRGRAPQCIPYLDGNTFTD